MRKKTLVSFCMPVYNKVEYLADAVESFLQQTHKNCELLIVDDKSTDKVYQLYEYYKKYSNIRIILNERNQGVAYSRNRAREEAKGEIICIMDADDMSEPNRAELAVNYFKKHKDVSVLYGNCTVINGLGQGVGTLPNVEFCISNLKISNFIAHPTVAYRNIREVPYYREGMRFIDDWYFYMDCIKNGLKFARLDNALAVYRPLPEGLTLDKGFENKAKTKAKAALQEEFKDYNDDLSDVLMDKKGIQYKRVQAILKAIPAGSKVLDVGCNGGAIMELLKKKKCKVKGLDNSPNLVSICKSKKLEVEFSNLMTFPFLTDVKKDMYDVILMGDILEHFSKNDVSDILSIYKENCLKAKGNFVITVPYKHSPYAAEHVEAHVEDYEVGDFEKMFPKLKYKSKPIMIKNHAVPVWNIIVGSR